MLTAIIATHESERALVPTLAALVPGATSGLLSEVILTDAASRDATAEVAEIAGCRFLSSSAPLGVRLKEAAASARTPWLLFLRPGAVPEPGWFDVAASFIRTMRTRGERRAATFQARPVSEAAGLRAFWLLLNGLARRGPSPDQGLLISAAHYDTIEGHPEGDDAERLLLHRIGRRGIATLPAAMTMRSET